MASGPAATNDKALEDFQEQVRHSSLKASGSSLFEQLLDPRFLFTLYQLVQDIIAGCKERQITELQTYYRLSGRTIFPVKDHHVGVRFETFYGGLFFLSFIYCDS